MRTILCEALVLSRARKVHILQIELSLFQRHGYS